MWEDYYSRNVSKECIMKDVMTIGALALSGLLAFLPASGRMAGAEEVSRAEKCFLEFVEEDLGGESI